MPGTEAVNCFTQNLSHDVNWLVSSHACVIDCKRKLKRDSAFVTLVLPEWKSVPFLIFICEKHVCTLKRHYVLPFTGAVETDKGNNGIF